jgi:hypothetical protein
VSGYYKEPLSLSSSISQGDWQSDTSAMVRDIVRHQLVRMGLSLNVACGKTKITG